MERNFNVVDILDSQTKQYLGQALYCPDIGDCPIITLNPRHVSGEVLEAFVQGARTAGGEINLYHYNMPIEINSRNVPYSEIRNTVVGELKMKTTRTEQQKQGE